MRQILVCYSNCSLNYALFTRWFSKHESESLACFRDHLEPTYLRSLLIFKNHKVNDLKTGKQKSHMCGVNLNLPKKALKAWMTFSWGRAGSTQVYWYRYAWIKSCTKEGFFFFCFVFVCFVVLIFFFFCACMVLNASIHVHTLHENLQLS